MKTLVSSVIIISLLTFVLPSAVYAGPAPSAQSSDEAYVNEYWIGTPGSHRYGAFFVVKQTLNWFYDKTIKNIKQQNIYETRYMDADKYHVASRYTSIEKRDALGNQIYRNYATYVYKNPVRATRVVGQSDVLSCDRYAEKRSEATQNIIFTFTEKKWAGLPETNGRPAQDPVWMQTLRYYFYSSSNPNVVKKTVALYLDLLHFQDSYVIIDDGMPQFNIPKTIDGIDLRFNVIGGIMSEIDALNNGPRQMFGEETVPVMQNNLLKSIEQKNEVRAASAQSKNSTIPYTSQMAGPSSKTSKNNSQT